MNRDLSETLRRLGACRAARDWAKPYGNDWAKALKECTYRDWLLWLAGRLCTEGFVSHQLIVQCACAYARTVLGYVPEGDGRPLTAIETTEKWMRGEATADDVRVAASATRLGLGAGRAAAYAAYAATDRSTADAEARAAASYVVYVDDSLLEETLDITKQHLSAALIEGLTRYAQA